VETRDRLILLLRDLHENLGESAWVILGILFVLGVLGCFVGLKWIWRGRMKDTGRKFFAEQRTVKHASKLR
jgi:hypothetical protein